MSLSAEDGSGVAGAESYATIAWIDAYWAARTHTALYTTWNAATTAKKEGAAREATDYADAVWGPDYRGERRGYVQGKLFPRSNAYDDAGYPLPGNPEALKAAVAELAARALSGPLGADIDTGKVARRVKAGSVEVEFAPTTATAPRKNYGVVADILAPLLRSSAGGQASWNWR